MRSFYASLFSTISTQFEKVQDPTLKEVLRLSTAEKLASAHAKVYIYKLSDILYIYIYSLC